MSKRRLSNQQKRRIQKSLHARTSNSIDNEALGPARTGLIISHHGKLLTVEDEAQQRYRCHSRQNIGHAVCGDRVIWHETGENEGVITAIKDRTSLLVRPGFGDRIKPVAANITLICIVIAPEPEPQEDLIDRYLVATEHLNIRPLIISNKTDLLAESELQRWKKRFALYEELGYEFIHTSTRAEHGLDILKEKLGNNLSILVGQSGVGKSSLINSLYPNSNVRVADLSQQITKGQHTTSHSELYHLPDVEGDLIDSPGVRDFRLGHLQRIDVEQGFVELRPFLGKCRFSDCRHKDEPECAVLHALEQGEINRRRLENFHAIVETN